MENKRVIIISPYFEHWKIISHPGSQRYSGWGLPVSYLKQWNEKWTVVGTAIVRKNDSAFTAGSRSQFGGALLLSYRRQENLT